VTNRRLFAPQQGVTRVTSDPHIQPRSGPARAQPRPIHRPQGPTPLTRSTLMRVMCPGGGSCNTCGGPSGSRVTRCANAGPSSTTRADSGILAKPPTYHRPVPCRLVRRCLSRA
jgi:hypothetical protein